MNQVEQRLRRLVQQAQRDHRIPAVQAAMHRADRPLWTFQVGTAGRDVPLDPNTRFRIGSVTKTLTAVMLLQCRDDGLLDLDDALGVHLPVPKHGDLTLRRLLSHTSGLQREPYGDVWDTLRSPGLQQALDELGHAERVLPPSQRVHYSNLGFALLGHVVAAKRGSTWEDVLDEKVLRPLGLAGTTIRPGDPAATGYLVDAYSDHARPEPVTDLAAIGPAAQLWSTASDMALWAAFLADPATVDPKGDVLSADTVAEMALPLSLRDEAEWRSGFGLGLLLVPRGGRVVDVGHGGAMPGFLAEVYGRRGTAARAVGAAVLLSSGTASGALGLTHRLMDAWLEDDPPEIEPWHPGEPAPEEYRSALGRWWGEGFESVFSWRDGALQAHAVDAPRDQPPARFSPQEPDVLRTVSGREVGELLRLTRDETGRVVRMHWATYRFTRRQETFDGIPATEP